MKYNLSEEELLSRKIRATKHGMYGTRIYISWHMMKQRCINKNNPFYHCYGGRGVKVCSEWISSFENFLSDMGIRPKLMTLDRKDNNGNYTPDNCRWADSKTQISNRRPDKRHNISLIIDPDGFELIIAKGLISTVCKDLGLDKHRIYRVLNGKELSYKGWHAKYL